MFVFLMLACTTPQSGGAEEPEPEVEEPAPEPEPESDTESTMLTFGVQCSPMPEGLPDSVDGVRTKLESVQIEVMEISAMPTCKACNTCPKLAVEVKTKPGTKAKIAELFPKGVAVP